MNTISRVSTNREKQSIALTQNIHMGNKRNSEPDVALTGSAIDQDWLRRSHKEADTKDAGAKTYSRQKKMSFATRGVVCRTCAKYDNCAPWKVQPVPVRDTQQTSEGQCCEDHCYPETKPHKNASDILPRKPAHKGCRQ